MQKSNVFLKNSMESRHTFEINSFVSAYYFTAKPDFDPVPEQYDFSQIFLVLDGTGTYTCEHGAFPISPGVMFYRPANKSSIYTWDTDRTTFGIISFVCPSPTMQVFEDTPIFLREEERATLLDVIKTGVRVCEPLESGHPLRGMRYKADTPDVVLDFLRASLERFFAMLYCRLEGIDLLTEQAQKVSYFMESSTLVENAKHYLAEHVEQNLSIKELCAALGTGQTALMKKFKQETGHTIIEYFTLQKIKKAKQMIKKTSKSFTEIAELLGFSSVNYFSEVFKRKTGMTPTEYSRYVSKHDTPKP